MTEKKRIASIMALLLINLIYASSAVADDRAGRNLEIMVEAARKLEFLSTSKAPAGRWDSNRAYLLIKQETVRSPVAVVFGYVDNAEACGQIAEVLSNSLRAGTFKCSAIH